MEWLPKSFHDRSYILIAAADDQYAQLPIILIPDNN
jgi:hypothetical protein